MQEQFFAPFFRIVNQGINSKELDKIRIREIISFYLENIRQTSSIKQDSFLLLALSIVLRKKAQKLKLQVKEDQIHIYKKEPQTEKRVQKKQKTRREQIVQENQLLKLPMYLESQSSQIVEEQQISLNEESQFARQLQYQENQQQLQQQQQMEEEDEVELLIGDHREFIKEAFQSKDNNINQSISNKSITSEKKYNNAFLDVADVYQKMMNLSLEIQEEVQNAGDQIETTHNSRKKSKAQMDKQLKVGSIHYRSQFIFDEDYELLGQKMEQYLLMEQQQIQQQCFEKKDELLMNLLEVLEESQIQDQLISILNPEDDEIYMLRSQQSNKSILKSNRMLDDSSNNKSKNKQIRFNVMMEHIQEETSHHYTTSMSNIFQSHNVSEYINEKSISDKAKYFYNILNESMHVPNFKIVQQNKENFGPIHVQFRE